VENDQLLSELRTSAIKPKQNEGSERLASEETFSDFSIVVEVLIKKVNFKPHKTRIWRKSTV